MPIYEFACADCGHEFEELIRTTTGAKPDCPRCGAKRTSKKLSVFASSTKSASGGDAPPPSCGAGSGPSCGRCCAGVPHHH